MLDVDGKDKMEGEEPTLFHVLKRRKLCEAREIRMIKDRQGITYTRPQDIMDNFVQYLTQKYEPIDVEDTSIAIMETATPQTCPTVHTDQLESPLTYDEILMALRAGAHHNAPGIDGLGLEFYTENWDTIKSDLKDLLNRMFRHNQVSTQQKHGMVVCLPKSNGDPTPDGYSPITLLTTEYKLLARIMARRLLPIMEEHLRSSQFCAVPGNTILDAVATVRDAITYAENTGTPLCMLTLDFEGAFDRISHYYLFHIFRRYGISHWYIERIRNLYDGATASIQINGTLKGHIPIHCAVRQGCPLSMVLYALCLQPLLQTLEDRIPGIYFSGTARSSPVLAYADDITVLVTRPEDFDTIRQAVHTYEKATGAQLNTRKSKALSIANWATPATALGIDFQDQIMILGVKFACTLGSSMKANWDSVDRAIRAQARVTYARQLSLAKRPQNVQLYLLSKIWYITQTLPSLTIHIQQLTSVCSWYIWQGTPFKAPEGTGWVGPAGHRGQMLDTTSQPYLENG